MLRCWVLVFFAPVITQIAGHGAVVSPRPRNAIDRDLSPWSGPVPKVMPGVDAWCPVPQADHLSGENGQACFWFSNGCSIGCPECDGTTRGPIPDEHGFRKKMDVCGKGFNATICDPALRTVNTGAECGAADDWYYFSPWRAPGSSPVFDACGMAGGTWHAGGYGAVYKNTSHAHQGDLGSKVLPKTPTGTTWKQGESYEVAWTVQANHGGGYSYRLCPAGEELTEECFAKTPLDFVGMQSFRWNGDNGTQVWFHGKYVTEGTYPVGSMWAKNPLPRNDTEQTGQSFAPSCEEVPNCGSTEIQSSCLCSGMWGPYNLEVVDRIMTPKHLPPGDYVLGWRWDCEESTQVWTSCSDITIVA